MKLAKSSDICTQLSPPHSCATWRIGELDKTVLFAFYDHVFSKILGTLIDKHVLTDTYIQPSPSARRGAQRRASFPFYTGSSPTPAISPWSEFGALLYKALRAWTTQRE